MRGFIVPREHSESSWIASIKDEFEFQVSRFVILVSFFPTNIMSISQSLDTLSTGSSTQLTLVSSDGQEFMISKVVLATHSTFFDNLLSDASAGDDRAQVTESSKELVLFLEVIRGRAKGSYSCDEARSLALAADKYDCSIVAALARMSLV